MKKELTVAFLALLSVTAEAQTHLRDPQRQRQKVLGRALQLDGQPWAQATVRLVAWPYPRYWFIGEPDELTVTTDAGGRFEAPLLPQRHYSAWAFTKLETGGYRVSKVANDIVPACLVELREREYRQARVRLRIVEPDGKQPFGRLSFRIVSRAPSQPFVHNLTLDENSETDLPAIPSSRARIEALTSDRVRVWGQGFSITKSGREAARKREPSVNQPNPAVHVISGEANDRSILTLPKPTPIAFLVQDDAGPVAGAEILIGAQSSAGSISDVHECRVITRTDASGKATLPMYLSWKQNGELTGSRPDVVVRSSQHFERLFRMMRDLRGADLRPTRKHPEATVTLTGPSFAATGQLMLGPGKPAADTVVLLYASYSSGIGRSRSISTRPIATRTNAQGAFAFPGRVRERDYRLTALLPTPEARGREEVYLASSTDALPEGSHGTLITSEWAHIDFQIKTPTGLPADRARIYLAEERDRPTTPVTYLTDRSGRCSVRVPREKLLNVIVASDDGFAAARLDHPGQARRISQELQLKIGGSLTGVAVDPDGKPLAHVRVHIRGGSTVKSWYADLLRDVSMSTYALEYRSVYTDSRGNFRAVYPEAGVQLTVTAWRRMTGAAYMELRGDSPSILLQPSGNRPLRLVLENRQ